MSDAHDMHDMTMTLEDDEREPVSAQQRRFSYELPDIDDLFPMPDVSSHALASWKASPMTSAVITLIHRMRHAEVSDGFRGNEEGFLLRKGRVEAFDRLLGEIDQLEAAILSAMNADSVEIEADIDIDIDDDASADAE